MKLLKTEHHILSALLIISGSLLCIFWLYREATEWFSGGAELVDLGKNICLGYVVSYIFYYINVHRPARRKFIYDCNYVGDCIAYLAFNMLQLSDVMNDKSDRVIFLGTLGSMITQNNGNTKKPELANKQRGYCDDLVVKLFHHIREHTPEAEVPINKIMFKLYPFRGMNMIQKNMCEREIFNKLIDSVFIDLKKDKNESVSLIGKRAKIKLQILDEAGVDILASKDLGIEYGTQNPKLRKRS